MKTFSELGLLPELLRALQDAGYESPTPIQEQAIPVALQGSDLLGCAQTGTGKTAGFMLPTLQRLARGPRGRVRALVLTPTRELAAQIGESARDYGKYLPLRSCVIFGGVGYGPQKDQLRRGVEILIATPGRLLDLMQEGFVRLQSLEVLVLDEADRMLDMGFLPDVRRVLKALPSVRQTLFFSATMPPEIEDLSRQILKSPALVQVGPRSRPVDQVRQWICPVREHAKKELLCHLLKDGALHHVLVFTRTKARADRVARHLAREGYRVAALHGNKSQNQRVQALDRFRRHKIDVLVATDIAARGIDVDGISHVINFDVPNVPEDYVHRIGRTARAEAEGDAISLVAPEEGSFIRAIERLTKIPIGVREVPGFVAPSVPSPAQGRPASVSALHHRGSPVANPRGPETGGRPFGHRRFRGFRRRKAWR